MVDSRFFYLGLLIPDMKKIAAIVKYLVVLVPLFLFENYSVYSIQKQGNTQSGKNQSASIQKKWKFFVQPYENTKIYINSKQVSPKILAVEKTMALMEIDLSGLKKTENFTLLLENNNKDNIEKKINLEAEIERSRKLGNPELYQLPGKKSGFILKEYISTGIQPKSVTFLSNEEIAIPLLEDSGVNILSLKDYSIRKISPSNLQTGAKKGFVESLILRDKKEYWVTQMFTNLVHVFDLKTFEFKKTITLGGKMPKILTRDENSGTVFCSNWGSLNVSIIDPDKYKETGIINVDGVPRGALIPPKSKFMYVARFSGPVENDNRGSLAKIDLSTNKIVKNFENYGAMRHIVLDKNARIFVSDMLNARIHVYDTKTDRLVKSIPVFEKPNTIALSKDGKYLYVSCRGPNNPQGYLLKGLVFGRIYVIDVESLQIVESWEGGNQPTGLDVSPDDRFIVTSDFLDNKIRIYERLKK